MKILNDAAALEWLEDRALGKAMGLNHFDSAPIGWSKRIVRLPLSGDAKRLLGLAYVLLMSLVPDDEEENYGGGVIGIISWDIWSEGAERVGHLVTNSLLGSGHLASRLEPPTVLYDHGELLSAHAMLLQPMVFQWDAYYIPTAAEYIVVISHDEFASVLSRTDATAGQLLGRFQRGGWSPELFG